MTGSLTNTNYLNLTSSLTLLKTMSSFYFTNSHLKATSQGER